MRRVFLDANVHCAGSASPTGASALILQLTLKGCLEATASRLVLREAERNLRRKRSPKDLKAFHQFLRERGAGKGAGRLRLWHNKRS